MSTFLLYQLLIPKPYLRNNCYVWRGFLVPVAARLVESLHAPVVPVTCRRDADTRTAAGSTNRLVNGEPARFIGPAAASRPDGWHILTRVRRVRARQLVSGRQSHGAACCSGCPAAAGGGAARRRGPRRPAARRQAARPPAAPAQGAAPEVPARARAAHGLVRGRGEGARRRRGGGGGAREGEEDGRGGRGRRDGGGRAQAGAGGRAGGGDRRRAAVQRAPLHPLIDSRALTRVSWLAACRDCTNNSPSGPPFSFML